MKDSCAMLLPFIISCILVAELHLDIVEEFAYLPFILLAAYHENIPSIYDQQPVNTLDYGKLTLREHYQIVVALIFQHR